MQRFSSVQGAGMQRVCSGLAAGLQRFCSGSAAVWQRVCSGWAAGQQRFCSGSAAVLQRVSSGSAAGLQRFGSGYAGSCPSRFQFQGLSIPKNYPQQIILQARNKAKNCVHNIISSMNVQFSTPTIQVMYVSAILVH